MRNMRCSYCGNRIGGFRALWDREFCCAEHRKTRGVVSARLIRNASGLGPFEDWTDYASPSSKGDDGEYRGLYLLSLALLMVGLISFVGKTNGGGDSAPPPPSGPPPSVAPFLAKLAPVGRSVNAHQDFSQVASSQMPIDWKDLRPGGAWIAEKSGLRPGRLRIWTPSESLENYDFEFMGNIERKGMSWAFRAVDGQNYYASRLAMSRTPGRQGGRGASTLIRYAVVDGKIFDKVELPLAITLARNTDYKVRMSVRGRQFLTSVDGQVLNSWADSRISRGGVGFFSDDGDASILKWVTLSERDSLMGRVLSYFSLFVVPGRF